MTSESKKYQRLMFSKKRKVGLTRSQALTGLSTSMKKSKRSFLRVNYTHLFEIWVLFILTKLLCLQQSLIMSRKITTSYKMI